MNYGIFRPAAFAALSLTLAACGQAPVGGGQAAIDTDTPEYAAMEYRQGLMHVISYKAGRVRGMAEGEIPVDEDEFLRSARELTTLAGMIEDGAVPGSDSESLPGSNALPAIWDDLDAFGERAAALREAAETVASQAQAGGFEAARATASDEIGQACGGCHRNFRAD